jgi:bifunctional DNA-binding transcriptional regulator/antitoxin component of YhaV-PrlF toxin-antitoxin module
MNMIRSALTDGWQTTIPPEVRAALHLRPHQGLLYEIHGKTATIRAEGESEQAGGPETDAPALSQQDQREAARSHVLKNYLGHGQDE